MVSAKLALAARVDSYQNHPDGSEGLRLREVRTRVLSFHEHG